MSRSVSQRPMTMFMKYLSSKVVILRAEKQMILRRGFDNVCFLPSYLPSSKNRYLMVADLDKLLVIRIDQSNYTLDVQFNENHLFDNNLEHIPVQNSFIRVNDKPVAFMR